MHWLKLTQFWPHWGYNLETILAEKLETILRRGVFTTRPRDFYDVYILATTQEYDLKILYSALNATAKHRESINAISNITNILEEIKINMNLKNQWEKYQRQFPYAKDIEYEHLIKVLDDLLKTYTPPNWKKQALICSKYIVV